MIILENGCIKAGYPWASFRSLHIVKTGLIGACGTNLHPYKIEFLPIEKAMQRKMCQRCRLWLEDQIEKGGNKNE